MEIRRFYSDDMDWLDETFTLWGDEFLHMTKVLRYKVGYKAIVFSNTGQEFLCRVDEIRKDCVILAIEKMRYIETKKIHMTLYAGLLKNNKLDLVVQKAVELGVDRIIPFTSANCAETQFSVDRARKIALEAAKQCGAVYLSKVTEPKTFDGVLNDVSERHIELSAMTKSCYMYDDIFFAYENEEKNRFSSYGKHGNQVALIIGPEGGFTPEEAEKMKTAGAKAVTLGKRILRAETASIVGSALLLDAFGEFDFDEQIDQRSRRNWID